MSIKSTESYEVNYKGQWPKFPQAQAPQQQQQDQKGTVTRQKQGPQGFLQKLDSLFHPERYYGEEKVEGKLENNNQNGSSIFQGGPFQGGPLGDLFSFNYKNSTTMQS